MRSFPKLLGVIALLSSLSLTVQAAPITLDASSDIALNKPATGVAYSAQFTPDRAVNGNVTEPTSGGNDSGQNEWLVPDGTVPGSFTVDLGSAFNLTQIDLYNTHNGTWNDRGTTSFTVNVSPDNSAYTTLLTGTLTDTAGQATITPQTFDSSNAGWTGDPTNVRYVRFTATGGKNNDPGLNEIAIAGTPAVPEPATVSVLALGGGLALLRRGRRRG